MPLPKINTKAPQFCLQDQNEKEHCLKDCAGNWVLIYFYPKDDTPGCTKEACAIRDNFSQFKKLKITVFGISKDPVKKHKKFVDKYELPFTLLADDGLEVVKKYGVYGKKKFMGREYIGVNRISFLIDADGKIRKIYEKVKPEEHASEVLKDFKALQ